MPSTGGGAGVLRGRLLSDVHVAAKSASLPQDGAVIQ